ncbi:MAG TPA: DUF1684 domain-containing protein, partial [Thermoanaerobaculia bacterium]|nr:DUF1684 domain-containing protein [Thermoanaerobaculia bacterium]
FLATSLLPVVLIACNKPAETEEAAAPATPPATATATAAAMTPEAEVMQWRENRKKRLQSEDGWLTLVGLHWLREGENRIGSDKANQIVLPPKAPASAGTLVLRDGKVTLTPGTGLTVDGKPITVPTPLADDTAENGPTIVQTGTIRFNVIKRGERYGVRVKDSQAETRTHFAGLEYYPIDPKWRVEARLERYDPPKSIKITDITGMTSDNPSPGALVFTVDGKEHRLDPLQEGDELFIIFKDETSRKGETYPAGRYLYAKMPGPDGKVVVDFNKAYSPPCVFTPFATCPLPPPQNQIPVRVEAGEKNYKGGKHA